MNRANGKALRDACLNCRTPRTPSPADSDPNHVVSGTLFWENWYDLTRFGFHAMRAAFGITCKPRQSTNASIYGTVMDGSGAVLARSRVIATNGKTGVSGMLFD